MTLVAHHRVICQIVWLCGVIAAWALAACDEIPVALVSPNCTTSAIVGGDSSPPHFVPSQTEYAVGRLQNSERQNRLCSGTLIRPDRVLTAAHCVVDLDTWDGLSASISAHQVPAAELRFVVQRDDSSVSETLDVTRVRVHHKFSGGDIYQNDLAILTLDRSTTIADSIPIYSGPLTSAIGSYVLTSGWGSSECNRPARHEDGRRWAWTQFEDQSPTHLLIGATDRGAPTYGDSGGGVFVEYHGSLALVGVFSARLDDDCRVSAATALAVYHDWLGDDADLICSTHSPEILPTTCSAAVACARDCDDLPGWCALRCSTGIVDEPLHQFLDAYKCYLCDAEGRFCPSEEESISCERGCDLP